MKSISYNGVKIPLTYTGEDPLISDCVKASYFGVEKFAAGTVVVLWPDNTSGNPQGALLRSDVIEFTVTKELKPIAAVT